MQKQIREIIDKHIGGTYEAKQKCAEEILRLFTVSGSLLEQIREAFADYRIAEGCSCCRDKDAHEEAEKRLAELLKPEPYEDGSGWDWSKYRADR